MTKSDLDKQAKEILKIASEYGVESNYFFITTFKRYQVQLNVLAELEKKMNEDGATVTKEYVKGRENIYVNPAIKEYNNTTNIANKTVTTLMKIITDLRKEKDPNSSNVDPLLEAINGSEAND